MGNFDGVHAGHAALLGVARELAAQHGAKVIALSFDPHPISVLRPQATPARLTTFSRRRELLQEAGADEVRRLEPTPNLLGLSPEAFVEHLVSEYHPAGIVEGPDFHFGKGRAGTVRTLEALGQRHGFEVRIVHPIAAVLSDQLIATASSTTVRSLITNGRVVDAWALLGRPYELEGIVERGDQRGRTIGFPTANLRGETMLPADGVYAAVASLDDGRWWPAAVNIGSRPTFDGIDRRVEAHLIGATGSQWERIQGLEEYGWKMRLKLVGWVRDQVKFPSIAGLIEQIGRDRTRAAAIVRRRQEAA